MESQLTILLPIAAVWLAAGVVADGLPRLRNARLLRRRTGWLLVLALTGVALTAAVLGGGLFSAGTAPVDQAAAGLTVAAGPALCRDDLPRVRRIRRLSGPGAGAGSVSRPPGH
ncbi:hypothetical protein JM949_28470, partial [Micromonospora sp. STR1s_6]|nr:hypothetical protein [Micromonospora tarensis]